MPGASSLSIKGWLFLVSGYVLHVSVNNRQERQILFSFLAKFLYTKYCSIVISDRKLVV